MRIFKITDKIEVVCTSESTRYGFRHLATLLINGIETATAKCTYQNRTWEKYEFQSVLSSVIDKSDLSDSDKKVCKKFIEGDQTDWSVFKSVEMVAKLGDVLCDTKKEKNDWKTRMIKAGLENQGLIIPDDWDSLDENTKEKRLNKLIELIGDVDKK